MAEYLLRPLTAADLPALAALEGACFSHPWTERQLTADLENDLLTHLGAVSPEGALLGYAQVRTILDEGTLERIAVAPQYRRQGVAEALLRRLMEDGKDRLAFLTLEVRAGNAPAVGLYEKLGFQAVGRRKNYYREEGEDALLMTAYLHPPAE